MKKTTAKKTSSAVTVGSFTIPPRSEAVHEQDKALIPSGAEEYADPNGLLDVVGYALAHNAPALIVGETGTGKTSAIRYACKVAGLPYRRINLNGGTSVDELVGKILIKDGTTYWNDGMLVDAMKRGHVIVFDEINAGQAEVLFVLQSLLDDDRMVIIDDGAGTIVRPHPDFRFFATMNPAESGGYAGTRDLNKALMSRFDAVHFAEYPNAKTEQKLIVSRVGDMRMEAWAGKLVEMATTNRAEYRKQTVDDIISTRDLLACSRVAVALAGDAPEIDTKVIKRAVSLAITSKMTKDGRDGIDAWLLANIGRGTKPALIATIAELEAVQRAGTIVEFVEDCSLSGISYTKGARVKVQKYGTGGSSKVYVQGSTQSWNARDVDLLGRIAIVTA